MRCVQLISFHASVWHAKTASVSKPSASERPHARPPKHARTGGGEAGNAGDCVVNHALGHGSGTMRPGGPHEAAKTSAPPLRMSMGESAGSPGGDR